MSVVPAGATRRARGPSGEPGGLDVTTAGSGPAVPAIGRGARQVAALVIARVGTGRPAPAGAGKSEARRIRGAASPETTVEGPATAPTRVGTAGSTDEAPVRTATTDLGGRARAVQVRPVSAASGRHATASTAGRAVVPVIADAVTRVSVTGATAITARGEPLETGVGGTASGTAAKGGSAPAATTIGGSGRATGSRHAAIGRLRRRSGATEAIGSAPLSSRRCAPGTTTPSCRNP